MELPYNDYLLENFSISDVNKITIKKKSNTNNILYPVIKKKIIRNLISSLYDNQTSLYQIRNSFYDFISDINNIQQILTNVHKLLKYNINILNNISHIKNHLKEQSEQKNIIFKFSYFNKIYNGSNPLELYFYHNCFIIYLFLCNKAKLSLNTTVFDKTVANVAFELLNTMTIFISDKTI